MISDGPIKADPFLNYGTTEARAKIDSQLSSLNSIKTPGQTPSQNAFKSGQ